MRRSEIIVRGLRCSVVGLGLQLGPAVASAQQWPLHYPEPPAAAVTVARGLRFAGADTSSLLMDVYRPVSQSAPAPAIIFYTLYWPPEKSGRETNEHLRSWARIAAANGIVGIIADLRAEPGTGNATTPARALGDDFQRLVAHLGAQASQYGVDARRLAAFALSGAVATALPAIEDPRQAGIAAAVMYYGGAGARVSTFRADLPLLFVRAGLDSRRMNVAIDTLVALAIGQNAPITVFNHPVGHHAFEARDDNDITRHVIDQTLAFVKQATSPTYQAALRSGVSTPAPPGSTGLTSARRR
jgi:dienelactone hydrolase